MIDTNQLSQALAVAQQIHDQAAYNWPAICAGAVLVRTELKNFNAWAKQVAEYAIGHGGLLNLGWKLIWSREAVLPQKNAESAKSST